MTVLAWIAVAVSGWLVVSGLVGVVVGRMVRRRDEQQPAPLDLTVPHPELALSLDEAIELVQERYGDALEQLGKM